MSGTVNLRTARKQRARLKKRAQATQNAAKYGRSKRELEAEAARADKARRDLDGHRRE